MSNQDLPGKAEESPTLAGQAARYRALVEAAATMVWTTDSSGEFIEPQPDWESFTGQSFEEYRGRGWLLAIHPDDRELTLRRWDEAVGSTAVCQIERRLRRADGEYRWFDVRVVPVRDGSGVVREWVGADADIDDSIARRARMALLQDAGRLLGQSLDRRILEDVARLTVTDTDVPALADGCMITLSDGSSPFEHVSVLSSDPEKERLAAEMERAFPMDPSSPSGYPFVIRTGQSELVRPEDFAHVIQSVALNPAHLDMLRQLDMFSGICVPLTARGRTFGAVTLVRHGPERRAPFNVADVATAEELARRVALALDNARLFTEAQQARRGLSLAFAQAPMAIAVLEGPDLVFTQANTAYLALVGRDIVGKPLRQALPELDERFHEILGAVYRDGVPFTASAAPATIASGPDKSPELRYFDLTYQPLRDGENKVYAIAAVGVEVTDQVMARERLLGNERQLRTLVDAIPTLAWTARADGYIDWYNARWYEYTGTTPADMEGWGWQSVHDVDVLKSVLERWQGSISTGQPFEMTFPLRGADGKFRQFLTRVSPVRDAEGRVVRWFGTNTDVDMEHQARAAAERAQALAEEANAAKMRFLATMSHELRTPLNAIGGYAELISLGVHGDVTDAQREALVRITRSQRHLLGLINDVLNFARLEAGHVEYNLKPIAVIDAVDSIEPLVTPQLLMKKLSYERVMCDPMTALADEEKLEQILINLVSNAIKFTPEGGRITLRCEAFENTVGITVEDTGVGIPEDRQEQVFAPFVQVDRGRHVPEQGTGLGLAISRDLARAMGGDITVRSRNGEGSAFTLTLPRVATP